MFKRRLGGVLSTTWRSSRRTPCGTWDPIDEKYEVHALIHSDETGYWATVAELPGVFAAGKTRAELLKCLDEAIRLYLDETGVPPELEDPPIHVERFSLGDGGLVPV